MQFTKRKFQSLKGKEKLTQYTQPINKDDTKKMYESGLTLQNKVFFFEIMIFVCKRGRQNLNELKREDFSLCTDWSGVRYVCKVKDELTKKSK